MRSALVVLLLSSFARSQSAPPAFLPVLERHGLNEHELTELGWRFSEGRCVPTSGEAENIAPEQLDELLSARERRLRFNATARPKTLVLPSLELTSDISARGLDAAYDGLKVPAKAAPAQVAPPQPRPEADDGKKPELSPALQKIARELNDPKRRAAGLRALAARFKKDEDSDTGLSLDAPEALRLLTETIAAGRGADAAAVELRRELSLVAYREPEEKAAFISRLSSPMTMFVALSRSHAPHALDSRLYFARMLELLGSRSLTDFIAEADPSGKYAANFILRAHAYDALIPYLNRRPSQAREIASILFPDGKPGEVRSRASQLEGLLLQLNAKGRGSGALEGFVAALAEKAEAGGPAAQSVAAFLKINEDLLPRKLQPRIGALAGVLPEGVLEASGLLPEEPYAYWPQDVWRFVLHFASPGAFQAWRDRFLARGYALDSTTQGISLAKTFGSIKIVLEAKLYAGDDEDFLSGAESQRFLADVSRELRDPGVQGVILRNHAQFKIANLFGKGVTPHKLIIDGACRSAWDLQALRRKCPSCYFVVNTGSGIGHINNEAVIAVVEGLAARRGWDEIGEDWSKHDLGSSARMQGPWTPDFEAALKALSSSRKH